jgi:hypothetical protein
MFGESPVSSIVVGILLGFILLLLLWLIILWISRPFRKYLRMSYLNKHRWLTDYLIDHNRWKDWWGDLYGD